MRAKSKDPRDLKALDERQDWPRWGVRGAGAWVLVLIRTPGLSEPSFLISDVETTVMMGTGSCLGN